jgi:hypothetical protein
MSKRIGADCIERRVLCQALQVPARREDQPRFPTTVSLEEF